jgi:hypothetical protein
VTGIVVVSEAESSALLTHRHESVLELPCMKALSDSVSTINEHAGSSFCTMRVQVSSGTR